MIPLSPEVRSFFITQTLLDSKLVIFRCAPDVGAFLFMFLIVFMAFAQVIFKSMKKGTRSNTPADTNRAAGVTDLG